MIRASSSRCGVTAAGASGTPATWPIQPRDDPFQTAVVVPDHQQIRPRTLRRIISDTGLTVEQFMRLLGREGGRQTGGTGHV